MTQKATNIIVKSIIARRKVEYLYKWIEIEIHRYGSVSSLFTSSSSYVL